MIGREVGQIAEEEGRKAEAAVTAESKPHYDAAARQYVRPGIVTDAMRNIDRMVEADTTGLTHGELGKLRDQLENSRNIENLDRIRKNIRDRMSLPVGSADALDKELGAKLMGVMKPVVEGMEERSPAYVKAKQVHEQARKQILEPLLAGPIGKLAKRDVDTREAIDALFPKNPLAGSEGEITDVVGRLAAKNPDVARQLVRAHLETLFNQASRDIQGGPHQFGGANFAAKLAGNEQQEKNLFAAIEALPGGEGTRHGVERLLNILRATGQRQRIGSQTAFNNEVLNQLKDGNLTAETVRTLGTGIPKALRDRYERWALGGNMDELVRLLTHPEAADEFRKLAVAKKDSPTWRKVIASLGRIAGKSAPYAYMGAYGAGERHQRADGGKVGYPAKAASRMDRALSRAQKAIAQETRPLMQQPDEVIARALHIAKGG